MPLADHRSTRPAAKTPPSRRGLALARLALLLAAFGTLAAVAVPRLGQAAPRHDAAVRSGLTALRNALTLYAADHGGRYPELDRFAAQLTAPTLADGSPAPLGSPEPAFGPYLRQIPALATGLHAGATAIAAPPSTLTAPRPASANTLQPPADAAGWLYDAASGRVWPNDPAWF